MALFGDELAGVDEDDLAGVELDGPSARGGDMDIADIDCVTAHLTEIFDHDPTAFVRRARAYPHPHIHCYGMIRANFVRL